MSEYRPPLADMAATLDHVAGLYDLPRAQSAGLDRDMAAAVMAEAARFAADILAPLNRTGDNEGCRLDDGRVAVPSGFADAYEQFWKNGWNAVPFDPAYGGQGLPWTLTFALQEMWQAANLSFGLCPLLNQAAIEALQAYGTEQQKQLYLAKMISGEWAGTMQLTEPQAGTDVGALRTRAEAQDDGTYKIFGQKIYITFGDHEMTDNIIHMVLARLPDAPAGYKGISMFLVPKFIPDTAGVPGVRNDAYCTGIEHKMGIHGSPTCTMQYGERGGAVGYLIGRENEGLKNMFIMMNNARLSVGIQGVGLAERAYQKALAYARERVQGRRIDRKERGEDVPVIAHPDVRRMLMVMRSKILAGRALAYYAGAMLDRGHGDDRQAAARADLLTPVVKSWCTDLANEAAALGVQVHGGMGFIEETGAAQYVRDARILTIYEGTNGVQAQDLYAQKIRRDGGAAAGLLLQDINDFAAQSGVPGCDMLQQGAQCLEQATAMMQDHDILTGAYASVAYQTLFGNVTAGWLLARMAVHDDGLHPVLDFYSRDIMADSVALRDRIAKAKTVEENAFGS